MQKQLYPSEVAMNSIELHWTKNTIRSQAIYIIILAIVIGSFICLPFIYVNITVQGTGLIRPETEKSEVKSLISSTIVKVMVKEGQSVEKDQILIYLKSDDIDSRLSFNSFKQLEFKKYIGDLQTLASGNVPVQFQSSIYSTGYSQYKKKITENKNKQFKSERELKRVSELYKEDMYTKKDYDDLQFQLNSLQDEYKIIESNQISSWQNDLSNYLLQLRELESQMEQYEKEKENYVIKSPVSGTLEQFTGIYAGANIQAGQSIAVISPSSNLIAEVFIAPKDIGYLSLNTKARIMVDAYNYNDWGMLNGNITQISNDYFEIKDVPTFRVRCKMDQSYLQLKNGFRGDLKKGMSVRARFIVTRRSLYQLLYDRLNDWLNPALSTL